MNEISKASLFFKEVCARIKGDDAEAKAAKVARKAISAFDSQIAAQKAKLVDDETAVENAREAFNNTLYPTEVFTDNRAYCAQVTYAQEQLDKAEAVLQSTKDTITYFESLLKKVTKEEV